MYLKNEKSLPEDSKPKETKRKKKGKIAKVYELHSKGLKAKAISEKLGIDERLVRSYIWRAANPQKYKMLLARYFAKRKQRQENEAIKLAVKNSNKTKRKKKEEAGVADAE